MSSYSNRHRVVYRGSQYFRLVAYGVGIIYFLAHYSESPDQAEFGIALVALGLVYAAYLAAIDITNLTPQRLAVVILIDAAIACGLVLATNGIASPFKIYLIFLAFFVSYALGKRYFLASLVLVTGIYLIMGFIDNFSSMFLRIFLPHVAFFFISAFLGGLLAEYEDKMCTDLNNTLADVAKVNQDLINTNKSLYHKITVERAFFETGKALVSNVSLEETLQMVLDHAIDLVGASGGAIGLWDSRQDSGTYVIENGLPELRDQQFDPEKGVFGEVAVTRESVLVSDYARHPHKVDSLAAIESMVAVPLHFGREFLGVLGVSTEKGMKPFTREEGQVLEAFADLASAGITRANLYQEVSAKSAQLSSLLHISRQIVSSFNQETILNTVLRTAVKQTDSAWGQICLATEDGQHLRRAALFGQNQLGNAGVDIPISGNSLLQTVMVEGQMVEITDFAELHSGPSCFQDLDLQSAIIFPLVGKDRVLGTLVCATRNQGGYTSTSREYLTHLSYSAAIAIENARLYQDAKTLSERDPLTSLYNQRLLYSHLRAECAEAKDLGYPVTFIMLDVDDFKLYNDCHGHQAGDEILRQIGKLLRRELRETDMIYRYGGEEFCIILPKISKEEGLRIADRIHNALRQEQCCVTVSVGIAVFPEDSEDLAEVIKIADKAMYKAKQSGKNATHI